MNQSLQRQLRKLEKLQIEIDRKTDLESAQLVYKIHFQDSIRVNYSPYGKRDS